MNPSPSRHPTLLFAFLLLGVTVAALLGCGKDNKITSPFARETISVPAIPSGDNVVAPGAVYSASTGGASSSLGHSLEYRLDFDAGGAHRYSRWSADPVAFSAWPTS